MGPKRRAFLPRLILPLILAVPLPMIANSAAARSFTSDYAISLRGLPVGKASLRVEIAEGRYSIALSSRVSALMRIVSDIRVTSKVEGAEHDGSLRPSAYEQIWTEKDDSETLRTGFTGTSATSVSRQPRLKHPERYVPVTDEQKASVIDPVSGFIWPAAGASAADICERTLPLFDGFRRFDIVMRHSRTETYKARDDSFSGPATVCALRYRPISGHRPKKKSVAFMAANSDMEIWMADAGNGLIVPVRLAVRTKYGRLAMESRRFEAR